MDINEYSVYLDVYDMWYDLENTIHNYLDNFCLWCKIDSDKWFEYEYENFSNDMEDVFDDLISDVALLVGDKIYNVGNYNVYYDENIRNILYIVRNDRKVYNLVSWKYCDHYDSIILRYGVYGLERYTKLDIDVNKFLSQTNCTFSQRISKFLPISHFLNLFLVE